MYFDLWDVIYCFLNTLLAYGACTDHHEVHPNNRFRRCGNVLIKKWFRISYDRAATALSKHIKLLRILSASSSVTMGHGNCKHPYQSPLAATVIQDN